MNLDGLFLRDRFSKISLEEGQQQIGSGLVVKSAVIVIDIVSVQNLLRHSVVSFGKTLYGTFSSLTFFANSSKFQSYFYKS